MVRTWPILSREPEVFYVSHIDARFKYLSHQSLLFQAISRRAEGGWIRSGAGTQTVTQMKCWYHKQRPSLLSQDDGPEASSIPTLPKFLSNHHKTMLLSLSSELIIMVFFLIRIENQLMCVLNLSMHTKYKFHLIQKNKLSYVCLYLIN